MEPRPKRTHCYWKRTEGSFDVMHPGTMQARYHLVVPEEIDAPDPLTVIVDVTWRPLAELDEAADLAEEMVVELGDRFVASNQLERAKDISAWLNARRLKEELAYWSWVRLDGAWTANEGLRRNREATEEIRRIEQEDDESCTND